MSDKKTQAIDPKLVRELAAILSDTGLSEIEVEQGELRLRIARTLTAPAAPAVTTQVVHAAPPPVAAAPAPGAAPAADGGGDYSSHPGAVLSPMVGTAYLAANEDTPAFVKIGDKVAKGQTILLIEAMKTFNQIHAPHDGLVKQILVANADPVEFNQPLMIIE